ncbi:hypothetical protein GCU56_20420 [Geodermatophilus sabuli]|uniref:Uncharacterized protein n=1 Tax=Geodermatophilus sabuli TaxID=1564158 RepID=A0A7K3W5T6_9ACTN|nr:hypothetical protein [Geodermatophilus sabuli]NEK60226.1 hypothetical protein [Geodermatophilus sabuli]
MAGLEDDEVTGSWYDRSRRIAAFAWLYHAGLVQLAAVVLHGRGDRRTRAVWSSLVVRDMVTAALWRRRTAPAALASVALLTDVGAAALLRDRISASRMQADRSIGQFGVASGWALLLDQRKARVTPLLLIPLVQQMAYCRIWRLDRRSTAQYLLREMAWATASLWAVAGLRSQLEAAARTEQRIADVQRETRKLQEEEAAEVGVWFRFHERLSVFSNVRSRAQLQSLAQPSEARPGYERVADLAQAEHHRFRRDPSLMTLNALVARMLASRPPGEGSSWADALGSDEVVELEVHIDDVRWLVDLAKSSTSPFVIQTDIRPTAVHVEVRSARFDVMEAPDGWSVVAVDAGSVLRGALPRLLA